MYRADADTALASLLSHSFQIGRGENNDKMSTNKMSSTYTNRKGNGLHGKAGKMRAVI